MKKLSETKKGMLKRMPKFVRSDSHKKKRISKGWRRPKGLQSKMRLQKKGFRKIVKIGYRTPKELRHKHPSGLNNVFIENVEQLKGLNSEKEVITIKKVGVKNKVIIIKEAKKLKLKITNLDPAKFLKKVEAEQTEKKEVRKRRADKKEEKKKEESIEKKVEKAEKKQTEDLKQKQTEEKKEKDKVLTKK